MKQTILATGSCTSTYTVTLKREVVLSEEYPYSDHPDNPGYWFMH